MNSVPSWLQIAAYSAGILGTLGGAWFAIFVIWPSIRKQEEFFRKIEQRGVDKLIDGL